MCQALDRNRAGLLSLLLLLTAGIGGSLPHGVIEAAMTARAPASASATIDRRLVAEGGPYSDLRAEDALRYAAIFAAQEAGDLARADAEIAALDDTRLMGHVLRQRYMHPTAHRSTFEELQGWMAAYADHPGADRVHRLAALRSPSTRARLERARLARGLSGKLDSYTPPDRASEGTSAAYRALIAKARAAFYSGDDATAREAAEAAAALRRPHGAAPAAHWLAGLAAWRSGDVEAARSAFSAMADLKRLHPWTAAAAAYWTSRAERRLGNRARWVARLEQAAAHPTTFYGLLAAHQLGRLDRITWEEPGLRAEDLERLGRYPGGARALALLDAGMPGLAEQELLALHPKGDPLAQRAVLALAVQANLPAASLRVATAVANRDGQPYLAALYPMPGFEPGSGWIVDRALVFAIMRQESRFDPNARSHAGATGLMQLMPATASALDPERQFDGAEQRELLDPAVNIDLGLRYVDHLLATGLIGKDLIRLMAAYNAGYGNLRRWLREIPHDGDPLTFIESIPMAETRIFVERVLTNLWLYRLRLDQDPASLHDLANDSWPAYVPQDFVVQVADAH